MRGRERWRAVAGRPLGDPDFAHAIVTITNNGGTTRVRTAGPHGLAGGETVRIAGSSVSAYNTTHTVTSVVAADRFDTDGTFTSVGSGGTWQLA